MTFLTTDLCEANEGNVLVVAPIFQIYGGAKNFHGRISTVKVFEDNVLVRDALSRDGAGRVLVVDGGGSLRCALVGGLIAELAYKNHWAGIVVNGCIRDSEEISRIQIGVRALNTHPLKSVKKGAGDMEIPVSFGGVTFVPGYFIYADADGVVVAATAILE
ncbi:MAG: ribonuclease E activity regulator RraA [Burkholderiales bacterium]